MQAPLFVEQAQAPRGGSVALGVIASTPGNPGAAIGGALEQFGQTGLLLQASLANAREETVKAQAQTEFLLQNHDLERKAAQSQDFANAPGEFARRQRELITELSARIGDGQKRAQFTAALTSTALVSQGRVERAQLANQVDAHKAALDAGEESALLDVAQAGSPAERTAAIARAREATEAAAAAGTISRQEQIVRDRRLERNAATTDVLRTLRTDPIAAQRMLDDPAFAPTLDPVVRERFKAAAADAADTVALDRVKELAQKEPATASLAAGRVADPRHGVAIFERGIVPIEGGLRPDGTGAVSPAGALGVAQLMPATARAQARKLGLADVADLSDGALKERLLTDHDLNRRLGLAEFQDMLRRYGGNVAAAAAGYNAGPGNADKWVAAATAQFGENFTAAQFASVVGFKETRDYIGRLYGRFGLPLDGHRFQPHNEFRAVAAVSAVVAARDAEDARVLSRLASATAEADPITAMVKQGVDIDPGRIVTFRAAQEAAASRGDEQASRRLRELDHAVKVAPLVRRAYQMTPAALDGEINNLEAALTAPGGNPTQGQFDTLDALKAVRGEIVRRRNEEPIVLGGQDGARLYRLPPLDPAADPDDGTFLAALAERNVQAATARARFGGSASAFSALEASALKERYDAAPVSERLRLLGALGRTLTGQALDDSVAALAGNDVLAPFAARLTQTRPELARDILAGAALMKTAAVADKAALVRPALEARLGGQVYPSAQQQDAVVNAALALYTARRGTSGALYSPTDSAGIEQAIEDIAGKVETINGRKTPLPPSLPAHVARRVFDVLDDDDLVVKGATVPGGPTFSADRPTDLVTGQPISAQTIRDLGRFHPLGIGSTRYLVTLPDGRPVMMGNGVRLVLDLAEIARRPNRQTPLELSLDAGRAVP